MLSVLTGLLLATLPPPVDAIAGAGALCGPVSPEAARLATAARDFDPYFAGHNPERATTLYEEALVEERSAGVLTRLAQIHLAAGDSQRAAPLLEELLSHPSPSPDALALAAVTLAESGQRASSVSALAQALAARGRVPVVDWAMRRTSLERETIRTAEPELVLPHVELAVTLADTTLSGTARWHYVNSDAAPLTELHFALEANLGAQKNPELSEIANADGFFVAWEPSRTEVHSVRDAGGQPLAWRYEPAPAIQQGFSLARGFLVVELGQPLASADSIDVTIDFATTVPHRRGDNGTFNGDVTWRFGWFPLPRHRDADGWSDRPVPVAFTHRTRFVAPSGYRVLLGADHSEHRGTLTLARSLVAVRSIPLVASRRLRCLNERIDGIDVSLCYYPDGALLDTSKGEAKEKLRQVERILRHHQERYGPYRLSSLIVAESPTTFLSMAADGLVLLGDLLFVHDRTWLAWGIYRPLGEIILAHELGHQWWGIGRAVDFDVDNWISEGLAELTAREYAAVRFGERGEDTLHANFFLRWMLANFLGTALPKNSLYETILPSYRDHVRFAVDDLLSAPRKDIRHREEEQYLLYEKGFLALRAFNALLGAERSRALWRVLAHEERTAPLSPTTLRAVALRVANVDVAPYLEQFVRGETSADLSVEAVTSESHPDGVHTRVRVARKGSLRIPATVGIESDHGRIERRWDGQAEAAELDFISPDVPREVSVDPEAFVPDVDRSNNFSPPRRRFGLLAPQADADTTSFALNPMPLHREYLAGVSLGARRGQDYAWWLGGGLVSLGAHADAAGDALGNWYEYRGYGELSVPWRRGLAVGLGARGFTRQDPLAGNWQSGELALAGSWSIYERTALGYPGTFELPRTTVSLQLRGGHAAVDGRRNWWMTPAADGEHYLFEGPRATLSLAIVRNELLSYGFLIQVRAFSGVHPWTRAATDRAAPVTVTDDRTGATWQPWWQPWSHDTRVPLFYQAYYGAESSLLYERPLSVLGVLSLRVDGGYVSKDADASARPGIASLPATRHQLDNLPYDEAVSVGTQLRVPLLRDLRIKNELTLGVLILNDLSFDIHWGGAWGRQHGADGARPPLGEVGAAFTLGIGAFLGGSGDVTFGVAQTMWPDRDAARLLWYWQLGVAL